MTFEDRAEILARLAAGRAALLTAIEGLSETEAAAVPGPDRWSAIDNIEHLAVVETNMLQNIERAEPIEGESKPGREQAIFDGTRSRERKFQAPPPARPSGRCTSLAGAIGLFEQVRGRTVAFVQSCDRDLRLRMTKHPLIGPVTAMECLYLVAAHPLRHAAQIRELRGLDD